jgi:acyl carrier protein
MLGCTGRWRLSTSLCVAMDDPAERLIPLLLEFFELPAETDPAEIDQRLLSAWDSIATVQLITDIEQTFSVNFEIEEIVQLTSYREIREALVRRGVCANQFGSSESSRQ